MAPPLGSRKIWSFYGFCSRRSTRLPASPSTSLRIEEDKSVCFSNLITFVLLILQFSASKSHKRGGKPEKGKKII